MRRKGGEAHTARTSCLCWQQVVMECKQLCGRARTYTSIIAADPALLIAPFTLLGLMLGLGVWAVCAVAKDQEHDLKHKAEALAYNTAAGIHALVKQFYEPVMTLGALLSVSASWPKFEPSFLPVARVMYNATPPGYITSLSVRPNGANLAGIYPLGSSYITANLINAPQYQQQTLALIKNGRISVDWVATSQNPDPRLKLLRVRLPVFVSNVSADEHFDLPPESGCPKDICYNNATHTKFWGIVSAGIDVTALANLSNPYFKELIRSRYLLRLTKWTDVPGGSMNASTSQVVAETPRPPGGQAVQSILDVPGGQWVLEIDPETGFQVSWRGGAIAVVVVFSVVLSLMLLLLLVSRREHQMLLTALVPKSVIERVKGDEQFIKGPADMPLLEAGTPAQLLLDMVTCLLDGGTPSTHELVQVRHALMDGASLYRPIDLEERMEATLDSDVRIALMRTLGQAAARQDDLMATHNHCHVSVTVNGCSDPLELMQTGTSTGLTIGASGTVLADQPASSLTDFTGLRGGLQAILSTPGTTAMYSPTLSSIITFTKPDTHLSTLLETSSPGSSISFPAATGLTSASNVWPLIEPLPLPLKAPPGALLDQVESLLASSMNSWHFDAFALDKATQGHALSTLGFFLIQKAGLMQHFKAPAKALVRYLCAIEAGYKPNPYHNSMHASSVLHAMHMFLCHGGLCPGYVDPLSHLACYLAAIIHDYEHQGLTNDYLINSSDALATRYNDRSPMENHHLAAAFELLQLPSNNFLAPVSRKNTAAIRKLVIDLVLATDMKNHFTTVSQFSTVHMVASPGSDESAHHRSSSSGRPRATRKRDSIEPSHHGHCASGSHSPVPLDEAERLLSLQMALKCADLSHLCDDLSTHMRWVACLEDEFFQQGDREKAASLPVSPLFDRDKPGVTKSQVGFFNFVAVPMFRSFSRVFQGAMPAYNSLMDNLSYWKKVEEDAKLREDAKLQGAHVVLEEMPNAAKQRVSASGVVAIDRRKSPVFATMSVV